MESSHQNLCTPTQESACILGVGGIFVVHAGSLHERRRSIERQLSAFNLPFSFVLEYDVPEIPAGLRAELIRTSMLSAAEESCALKHWRAHQLIVERQLPRALVLEDDVILSPRFAEVLAQAMAEDSCLHEPHVTFLGCGGHYYVPSEELEAGKLLYRRDQGKFGDSYVVTLQAAQRRLDVISRNGITAPIDHLFEAIDRDSGILMYWLEPPIVEQGSDNGRFNSALRLSRPLWLLNLQYRWKKFWRRRKHPRSGAST